MGRVVRGRLSFFFIAFLRNIFSLIHPLSLASLELTCGANQNTRSIACIE